MSRMFAKVRTIACAVTISALVMPLTAEAQMTRTIHRDLGGVLSEYVVKANIAELKGQRVRIAGFCASACTVFLGLSKTCVTKNAVLAFHGASGGTEAENARATKLLAKKLPREVRTWFKKNAATLQGEDYIELTAAQLVEMGAASWC